MHIVVLEIDPLAPAQPAARAPFGHWKTSTFVAALQRADLDAPMISMGR